MDPSLYAAAMEGKVDVLMRYIDQLNVQVTRNGNTVLHVAAQFGHLQCVEKILEEYPVLLHQVNIKSETPLHIAAREAHCDIVKELIVRAKELDQELESGSGAAMEMLRATNEDRDTALHMAVRSEYLDTVKLLTQEDRGFQHPSNNAEETPLYLAAESGCNGLVFEILENCKSPGYGGPGGRTALHAAVIHPLLLGQSIRKLLDWKQDLIKEADEYGWTPLHYAARCGNVEGVKQLLEMDKSMAYITTADNDDRKTALHVAAAEGDVKVMREILLHCPDCWEIVNGKGQNVLHIAVEMEKEEAIKFIKEKFWFSHLKKQKDIEGNTPSHLIVAASNKLKEYVGVWSNIECNWAFNDKNMTPRDVWSTYETSLGRSIGGGRNIVSEDQKYKTKWRALREENEKKKARDEERSKKAQDEDVKKRVETLLIVATLITTITFAAGFAIPGGYNGNEGPKQGMPILIRKAAFKAFVITNTIAVICSTSSVFLFLWASLYNDKDDKEIKKQVHRRMTAFFLILIAMGAMMVAFIAGTYAILAHSLGIAIILIGCISFLIYLFEPVRLIQAWA